MGVVPARGACASDTIRLPGASSLPAKRAARPRAAQIASSESTQTEAPADLVIGSTPLGLLVTIAVSSVRAPLGAGRPGASRMPLSARRRRASGLVALLALCSPPSRPRRRSTSPDGTATPTSPRARRSCSAAGPRPHPRARRTPRTASARRRLASPPPPPPPPTASPRSIPLDDPEDADGGLTRAGTIHVDLARSAPELVASSAPVPRLPAPRRCSHIVQNSTPRLKESTVVDNETGKSVDSTIRTSEGTFFSRQQDE